MGTTQQSPPGPACHDQCGRPDLVPGNQREKRNGQRVGERGERRRGACTVELRCLLPGEPLGGHRDGYEQQPDQRAVHAAARQEEAVEALWVTLAAETAYQHQWVSFVVYTCIALLFLVAPTGVFGRLGRRFKG